LAAFGYRLDPFLFTSALVSDAINQLLHPVNAIRRTWHWWSQAAKRVFGGQQLNSKPAP
jgi:hypothetical protein